MLPIIFCPDCQTYLGSQVAACPSCGRQRLPSERLPEPGQPLWRAKVESALHSALVVGDLVVFNAGERNQPGGVFAFDRLNGEKHWSFITRRSVEAGVAIFGDRLYFATCGFLGGEAELFCLQAKDGQPIWKQELTGGVWSKPLVDEARVYVGQDDGQVRCFDNRDGTPLCTQPVDLPRGRLWLEQVDGVLVALSSHGEALALNPLGLEHVWHTPLKLDCKVSSAPCAFRGRLFFGGEGGQVLSLDVHKKMFNVLAGGLEKVVSMPACSEELLFVGAHDHFLHAYDLKTWQEAWKSPEFEHSISSTPCAAADLVAVSINQSGLALLNARTGELAWHYPVEKEVHLLSSPTLHEGVIYAGTDKGSVFALPWHLGKFAWAADRCQRQANHMEAGVFHVLAAQNTLLPEEQDDAHQQAVACWQRARRMDLAGHFWEGLIEEKKAAEAYVLAGQHWIGVENHRAAEYYSLATQLYWQLDEEQASSECARRVQKLVRGPLLRIKPWTNPKMTQYKEDHITFQIENLGREAAEELTLTVGGSLKEQVTCRVLEALPAGTGSYFNVTLTIVPTKTLNDLVIQADYCSPFQKKPYRSTSRTVVEAEEAPIDLKIKDMMSLKDITIAWPQGRRVNIEIDGVVATGTIKIGETSTQESPAPLDFTWPERPAGLSAPELVLIQVREVKDEITIIAGHWAIFLADEAVIATVAPRRYTRKDFPALQQKFADRHLPSWKAVLFNSVPFRLDYRLGPFRTQEKVQVWVESGVTAHLDENHPLEMWKNILGENPELTTVDLANWLKQEVSGILKAWVAGQSEEALTVGFTRRDEVMLSLQEHLKQTHAVYGVALQDPLYLLDFIDPGRERQDGKSEEIYWLQQAERQEPGKNRCPNCSASLPLGARHCDQCGIELAGSI